MKPKLSIVICTYNRARSLSACLSSLAKQSSANFEIIIVDGGSTDGTQELINKFAKKLNLKKIIYRPKELARARDKGWRETKGELVAWIDDDITASKNWAKSIVEIFDKHPNIAGLSGPTIIPHKLLKKRDVFFFYHKRGIIGWIGKFWNNFFLEGGQYEVGKIFKSGAWSPGSNFPQSLKIKGLRNVDYLEACNMTLRKKLIAKAGGFDYEYTGVAEWSELDLAMKIKKLGYRLVFNFKVRVDHQISQGGAYSRRTHAKQRMENFFKFYFRHVFKFRLDYFIKFLTYLLFLNFYWGYKALSNKNIDWLGGWLGNITGLKKAL